MPPWQDPVPALKRRVADEILTLTDGWSQSYAAAFMHVSQSRVSDMRSGHLERISLERMLQCLSRLGRRVDITSARARGLSVHPHWKIDGRTWVSARRRGRAWCTGRGYPELDNRLSR